MPTYTYENFQTGERVDAVRTIAQRDDCPAGCRRVIAPGPAPRLAPTSGLFTGRARDPGEAELAVPRALRQIEEQQHGTDRLCREAGFSVRQFKESWNI